MKRVAAPKQGCPKLKYANCGRTPVQTPEQQRSAVAFVKMWRAKRFRASKCIVRELKLKCGVRTVQRTSNAAGFFRRAVPKKTELTKDQLKQREAFVTACGGKSARR